MMINMKTLKDGLYLDYIGWRLINMDDNYKNNLLKLYSNFYDKKTLDLIKSLLYK